MNLTAPVAYDMNTSPRENIYMIALFSDLSFDIWTIGAFETGQENNIGRKSNV